MIDALLFAGIDPTAFRIGSIEVRWYALFIVFSMIIGLAYVCVECKKIGLVVDDAIELFLWVIPLAIVFARIMYIIPGRVDEYFPWKSWDDFVDFVAIWNGGLTIIGGILGGVIGGVIFTVRHRKKCNFGGVADLVVVPLLSGQIIGRLGNFVNQEAFGLPIFDKRFQTFPFGVYIDRTNGGYESSFNDIVSPNVPGWFCATFFYEMCWNSIGLGICLAFWRSGKNKKYPGLMLIFYFFWYMLGRLWLEFLRVDAVPVTRVLCGVVFPIAALFGAAYVLYCNSRASYKYVRAFAKDGVLKEGALLTQYDVKNYGFVGRLYSKKNPLSLMYGKAEYLSVDFEKSEFFHVPKWYKKKFAYLVKTALFERGAA